MRFAFLLAFMTTSVTYHASAQDAPTNDTPSRKISDVTEKEDPYLWLEDVEGERALDWVRQRNAVTQKQFESTESFSNLRDDLLKILDSKERIPGVSKTGDFYYNFWRDAEHERGIWRRTTLEEYRKAEPKWEILLDLDAVAAAENAVLRQCGQAGSGEQESLQSDHEGLRHVLERMGQSPTAPAGSFSV